VIVTNPRLGIYESDLLEVEMKSRVIQLYIDVSIWNKMAILGPGCIQVKGEIVRIVTGIRCEGGRRFRDQRTDD